MSGERVDIGDWCTLYHADSMEIVETLIVHSPDAVIMDPPYGIGLKGAGHKRGSSGQADTVHALQRGSPRIAGDDTGATLWPWFDPAFPQLLFWGADHDRLRMQIPEGGRFLAWDKLAGMDPWDSFCDVEIAWHSRPGAARLISYKWKGIACTKASEDDFGTRHHPMMKPCAVMEWCIDQCRLEPGATILDPYMGSGTTALAAFKKRMKFVGVEIDRRWFDVAVERIQSRTGDGPLFDAPPDREPVLLLEVSP